MFRRIVLAAALAVATGVTPTPARAASTACYANGTFHTSSGLGSAVLAPRTVSFAMVANFGGCASLTAVALPPALTLHGSLTGGCDYFRGTGVVRVPMSSSIVEERTFVVDSFGSKLVFSGGVAGTGSFVPDVTYYDNSCANGTARVFLVTLAVVLA